MAFPFRRILCPVDFDDSSIDALETAAAKALAQFKADECLNFFAHAGYGLD